MKKRVRGIISIVVIAVMMCSMVSGFAYGTNSVNGTTLKVEVFDEDGTTIAGSWIDPATSAVTGNEIWVTSAQMLKITVTLSKDGAVTVFSYADGTTVNALTNDNIQYVGQEESGTVIEIRPRATLPNGKYIMYIGGDNVSTPYSFTYNVGIPKVPLDIEGVTTRVPKVSVSGSSAVTYKLATTITDASDITDIKINDVSISDSCTVAYDLTESEWNITIPDAGKTYAVGTHTAVIYSKNNADTAVRFTVYDAMSYIDENGNLLYTSEIADSKATLKPDTAHNGVKVASVDRYYTGWSYNDAVYNAEKGYGDVTLIDGKREAVLNTATVQEGYDDGGVISKAGAQWVRYTVEDTAEIDISVNRVGAETDGTVTTETENDGTFKVAATQNGNGRPYTNIDITPKAPITDAYKTVTYLKFKTTYTSNDGSLCTDSGDATAKVCFVSVSALGQDNDGTVVSQAGALYGTGATTWTKGTKVHHGVNHFGLGIGDIPKADTEGFYSLRVESYKDADSTQYTEVYGEGCEQPIVTNVYCDNTSAAYADKLGYGARIYLSYTDADSDKTHTVRLKNISMEYQDESGNVIATLESEAEEHDGIRFHALLDYDGKNGQSEIAHVGVVVSNVAQAPTIEAGYAKTESTRVYDAVYSRQGDAAATIDVEAIKDDAQENDSSNRRFSDSLDSIFYAIVKIPEERKNQKVYATPYVQFADGSRIYGSAVSGADGVPGVSYNELKGIN